MKSKLSEDSKDMERAREWRKALAKELPTLTPYGEEIFDSALAALLNSVREQAYEEGKRDGARDQKHDS